MLDRLSRRTFLVASGATAVHTAAHATTQRHELVDHLHITAMLVDGIENPIGVHTARNRLSWQILGPSRNLHQAAYRIGVASSRAKALDGHFDLWDSGQVTSTACFDIAYAGRPLKSRERAWWVIVALTSAGEKISSPVSFWEMGILEPTEWVGRWIAAEDIAAREERTAGFYWMTKPEGAQAGNRSYRLQFNLPEAAEVTILVAMNAPSELFVDDITLPLPSHDPRAWCALQSVRISLPLAAGAHTAVIGVPASSEPKAALLVRAKLSSGRVLSFDDRNAQTRDGKPSDVAAAAGSAVWTNAVVNVDQLAPMPVGSGYLLRRSFSVAGAIASARFYVTALGVYEAHLNGTRLGEALLTPEFTDYRKRALYAVHDVTDAMKQGENVLGGIVGEGWYGSSISPNGRYSFGPAPLRLMAQLEIDYVDGRRQVVSGDEHWQVARAPITMSGIYDGEDYDARLEQPGWAAPGFVSSPDRWENAEFAPVPNPSCRLIGAISPPIRRMLKLVPKSITRLGEDRQVIDFGQNFAGWARLRVKGRAGQQVTMKFAELIADDGSADQSNLRGARAADRYILRGDPLGETYEPRFTYHGFRYVEIEGLDAPLREGDITGIEIRSSLAETGELTLDQYVPQRLWQNALWSQRSNFMGIPTDCPQRDERLGWMGDAHVFWDAAAYNMDVASFTSRYMGNVEDAQRQDGGYPDFAPDASDGKSMPAGSSPGWADAGIILPWTVWWRYGDTGIVDSHWASMVRFMDSILRANPEHIWSHARGSDYGDWLSLDAKYLGAPTTPKDLIGTAMWKASADAMAQMAAATGRNSEAEAYTKLASDLVDAFARTFVKDDGIVGNGSQTGYIQALRFGLLAPALRFNAARHLADEIVGRGTLLSTGFLGTPYSLDVLADAGQSKLVYDLLLRTAYPSWGYMIAKKATTIWERWNGDTGDKAMNSFNHYALGAVAGFLYRRIAGIDALTPGFTTFRFNPVYDERLKTGGGQYRSRAGLISTRWERASGGDFRLQLQVPPNTRASVVLPAHDIAQLRDEITKFAPAQFDNDPGRPNAAKKIKLELGAGNYDIRVAAADYA